MSVVSSKRRLEMVVVSIAVDIVVATAVVACLYHADTMIHILSLFDIKGVL